MQILPIGETAYACILALVLSVNASAFFVNTFGLAFHRVDGKLPKYLWLTWPTIPLLTYAIMGLIDAYFTLTVAIPLFMLLPGMLFVTILVFTVAYGQSIERQAPASTDPQIAHEEDP